MELIRPEQKAAAAQTLAEAFADDPLLHILQPDDSKRAGVAPWFMGAVVDYGMRWGEVSANDDASAVAIWLPPESGAMSAGRMLRVGMGALPFKIGPRGALRFTRILGATETLHKAVHGPHWYLVSVGTRRSRQGQGLGSALVELGTSRADAAGLPCYLETATQSNIDFYAKRGFEVTGQVDAAGFTIYGMVRQPKA